MAGRPVPARTSAAAAAPRAEVGAGYATHEVLNQPDALANYDAYGATVPSSRR